MNLENNNKRTRKVLKVKDLLAVIFIVISIPATNAENRTSYPSNVTHDASVNALLLRQTSSEQGYGQDGVMFIFDERQRVELLLFGERILKSTFSEGPLSLLGQGSDRHGRVTFTDRKQSS